jgi:hypothetical protein
VVDLRSAILSWYDGYSGDGEPRALNPLSLLSLFLYNRFNPYWLETNPSGSLLAQFHSIAGSDDLNRALPKNFSASDFAPMAVEALIAVPLLFQIGYLTVYRKVRPK